MTLLIVLTVVEIVLLVGVLAYFLDRVAKQLNRISRTLAKIAFGVRAVETQCLAIGPAADKINANLLESAGNLTEAIAKAERLTRR